jgi:predicted nucleic acid-binding protein
VTVLLDTSAVVAFMDAGDPSHGAAVRLLGSVDDDLVTTPLVIAEMDREISARGGRDAAKVLWSNFESGAFISRWWADGLTDTVAIARRYPFADLPDASLVALAGIVRTNRIATFDEHFRSMTTPRGDDFVLLPAGD